MTLLINGDSNNALTVSYCSESLRNDGDAGIVSELSVRIADKTLDDLKSIMTTEIERIEVFDEGKLLFSSTSYTEINSINNNIGSAASGSAGVYMTLRAEN